MKNVPGTLLISNPGWTTSSATHCKVPGLRDSPQCESLCVTPRYCSGPAHCGWPLTPCNRTGLQKAYSSFNAHLTAQRNTGNCLTSGASTSVSPTLIGSSFSMASDRGLCQSYLAEIGLGRFCVQGRCLSTELPPLLCICAIQTVYELYKLIQILKYALCSSP